MAGLADRVFEGLDHGLAASSRGERGADAGERHADCANGAVSRCAASRVGQGREGRDNGADGVELGDDLGDRVLDGDKRGLEAGFLGAVSGAENGRRDVADRVDGAVGSAAGGIGERGDCGGVELHRSLILGDATEGLGQLAVEHFARTGERLLLDLDHWGT